MINYAILAQLVEYFVANEEVIGSRPIVGLDLCFAKIHVKYCTDVSREASISTWGNSRVAKGGRL